MHAWKGIRFGLRTCSVSSREANNVLREGCRSLQTERASREPDADSVKIPFRIQRGPTDILKALSGTVSRDTTAPHYKYLDDPFLAPMSNAGKRNFAMAREAGRKAATWVRSQHAELFESPQTGTAQSLEDGNEAALGRAIDGFRVTDAIEIYTQMEGSNESITDETRQSFLELLCFFNEEQPLPEDLIEERWFRQGSRSNDRQGKTWKDGGVAERVFASLPASSPAATSALVCGMARFGQHERALELYRQAGTQALASAAFDALIGCAGTLRESPDLRWNLVVELLKDMSSRGVRPTVRTLNATLEALASLRQHRPARALALATLAEFSRLGVHPSMATFHHLLVVYSRDRSAPSSVLSSVLTFAEGRVFPMVDPQDAMFFAHAMETCRQLRDPELAHRLHGLLLANDNQQLIGDSLRESVYYRHYFALVCSTEPLNTFMAFYDRLVPNIYTPEPGVMEEVLRAIDFHAAPEVYPRIWSDMRVFDHAERENLVSGLLAGMVKNGRADDEVLSAQLATVAWEVWTKLEEPREGRYNKLEWLGSMLGDVMTLSLRAGELDRATLVLSRLATGAIAGVPDVSALQLFLDISIVHNSVDRAVACVQYAANAGFPDAGRLAQQLIAALPLNAAQLARLEAAVGQNATGSAEEATT